MRPHLCWLGCLLALQTAIAPDIPFHYVDDGIFDHLEDLPHISDMLPVEPALRGAAPPPAGHFVGHLQTGAQHSHQAAGHWHAVHAPQPPHGHTQPWYNGHASYPASVPQDQAIFVRPEDQNHLPNSAFPSQQWTHDPFQTSAPQRFPAYSPQPLSPLQSEESTPFVDRNPDDLSAVIKGLSREPPRQSLTEPMGEDATDSTHVAPPHGQNVRERRPYFPVRQSVPLALESTHISLETLHDVDPLLMSDRPVVVIYQEDAVATRLIATIKDQIGISKQNRRDRPRPLLREDALDFVRTINYYMQVERLFKEFEQEGRRFLVNYVNEMVQVSKTLSGNGLIVWELQTDNGAQAVLLCRGVYAFQRTHWRQIVEPHLAPDYLLQFRASTPMRSGVLSVRSGHPDTARHTHRGRRRLLGETADPQSVAPQIWASSFAYGPEPGLEHLYKVWLDDYMSRESYGPPIELSTVEERASFFLKMRASFVRRVHVRPLELNGKTYLLTHHPAYPDIHIYSPFIVLWTHHIVRGENILTAAGLFPMPAKPFRTLKERTNLPRWRFHFYNPVDLPDMHPSQWPPHTLPLDAHGDVRHQAA